MKQKITISLILCLFLTGCLNHMSQPSIEYSSGLVNTYELEKHYGIKQEGNYLYFGNEEDGLKTYCLSLDNYEVIKISDVKTEGIGELEAEFYYKDSIMPYEEGPLKKRVWASEEETTIIGSPISQFIVTDDYIFYEQDQKIYRSDLDGKNKVKLVAFSQNVYEMQYEAGYLYFSTDKGVYRIEQDGTRLEGIVEGGYYKFKVYEQQLIYSYNDFVKRVDLETWEEDILLDRYNYELFVYDNALYYTQEETLYKKDLITKEVEEIYLGTYAYNFYGKGDTIYCFGDGYIWKIDKNLETKKIVYGKGKQIRQHRIMIDENEKVYLKGYDFDSFDTHINYLYTYNQEGKSRKLISDPVGETYLKEDKIYYINMKNKWLYTYDIKRGLIDKVLDHPMEEFLLVEEGIYFANEGLYWWTSAEGVVKLLDEAVMNLQVSDGKIYYINKDKGNHLYVYQKGVHSQVIDDFITEYVVIGDKIYYKNESQNGELYLFEGDKKNPITDASVDYLYQSGDYVYYIKTEGASLLYSIDPKIGDPYVVKFMGRNWLDYVVKNKVLYEVKASDDHNPTIESFIWDDSMSLFIDADVHYESLGNEIFLIDYENYLYTYNKNQRQLQLLHPDPIQTYHREEEWLYFSGNVASEGLRAYIMRKNLQSWETELLVSSSEAYTPAYEFLIKDQMLYYTLPFGDNKGHVFKLSLKDNNQQLLTEEGIHLIYIFDNLLVFENKDHGFSLYDLEKSKASILLNHKVEYVGAMGRKVLYFEYIGDQFEGYLKAVDIVTKEEMALLEKPIKVWDYTFYENKLYYIDEYLYEMTLETKDIRQLLEVPVDHFYFEEKNVVAYLSPFTEDGKIIKVPIQ